MLNLKDLPAQILLLSACMLVLYHVEGSKASSFCHGASLEVTYPDLCIKKCLTIPKEWQEDISTVWDAPQIKFSEANEGKMYVLVMVDPDAPSPTNPTSAYWRHWLVVDITGSSLKNGNIKGKTLTEYSRPTPPEHTGFHRYQFMLFEQPPDMDISLPGQPPRGKWDLNAFTGKFNLGLYVATQQFKTQNYKD